MIHSSVVYQGIARGLGEQDVMTLNEWATQGLLPDLVVLLHLDPEHGLSRTNGEPDRFESEAFEFHEKLREGFRLIAMSNPNRCVLIDARDSRQAVADKIWKVVNDRFDPATARVALGDKAS